MVHRHVEPCTPEQPACTEFVQEPAASPAGCAPVQPRTSEVWPTAQSHESDVADVAWQSIATYNNNNKQICITP